MMPQGSLQATSTLPYEIRREALYQAINLAASSATNVPSTPEDIVAAAKTFQVFLSNGDS